MTEYSPAVEVQKSAEDRRNVVRRTGSYVVEVVKDAFDKESTRRATGGLAIFGAASTAAEFGHWFNHSGAILEFMQGSGRHFFVGYLGAMVGLASSKAETARGKITAALVGGMAGDVAIEAMQAVVVTGALHHGSLKDIVSFATPKEVFWGNAKDALAAELAASGAAVQAISTR